MISSVDGAMFEKEGIDISSEEELQSKLEEDEWESFPSLLDLDSVSSEKNKLVLECPNVLALETASLVLSVCPEASHWLDVSPVLGGHESHFFFRDFVDWTVSIAFCNTLSHEETLALSFAMALVSSKKGVSCQTELANISKGFALSTIGVTGFLSENGNAKS